MTFKITLWGTGWGERLQTVIGSRETGRQGWSKSKVEMVVAWTRMPAEKGTKGWHSGYRALHNATSWLKTAMQFSPTILGLIGLCREVLTWGPSCSCSQIVVGAGVIQALLG